MPEAIKLRKNVTLILRGGISSSESELYEVGPFGILRLKKRGDTVNEDTVRKLIDEADEEEFARAMELRAGQ